MKLSLNNFLYGVKQIVTGGGNTDVNDAGFLKDVFYSAASIGTTGTSAQTTNSLPHFVRVLDADDEDAIFAFEIPRDYDEATDHLSVKLRVRLESGTSIDLTADSLNRAVPGADPANEADYSAPAATTVDGAKEIEVDLSGLGWTKDEQGVLNFAASNRTSAGIAHVLGGEITYRSTLVSYNEEDSNGNPLR
jgi:hypothetical protein